MAADPSRYQDIAIELGMALQLTADRDPLWGSAEP
jgi:hypothetical protein